jgi:SAM-dependent methyltransferase
MGQEKYSPDQMADYYRGIHGKWLETDPNDSLAPVTLPNEPRWVNSFVSFAHQLGVEKAFALLRSNLGTLRGRSVLDLGCGRGRWTKKYASLGCEVTGVDVSLEAVKFLAREMPEHRFLCQDISKLIVPSDTFDVVNSVTVLQHMPEELQREALKHATGALKEGGYLVLLENTIDFESPIVFPHRPKEWVSMAEASGLQLCASWGSNYEVLFRVVIPRVKGLLSGSKPRHRSAGRAGAATQGEPSRPRLKPALRTLLAIASFPLEWVASKIPMFEPTHQVMVFRK